VAETVEREIATASEFGEDLVAFEEADLGLAAGMEPPGHFLHGSAGDGGATGNIGEFGEAVTDKFFNDTEAGLDEFGIACGEFEEAAEDPGDAGEIAEGTSELFLQGFGEALVTRVGQAVVGEVGA